jgi:2,3-bisphosphoglycerate-dependent phosphoglycerate mutase
MPVPFVAMEIVLIRHGEPEWIRDGLNVDDPPLTERGRRQAERMAQALRNEHFDEVLVSPLVRAQQTAEPLLAALGADLEIAHWLEEIRNPVWHGTPRERAEAAYAAERELPAVERWRGLDGGEAVDSFVDRINRDASLFLAERGVKRAEHSLPVWTMDEPSRRIALVAHAGTNSVTICHLLGLSPTPWEWERFVLNHASISRLESMPLGDGATFCLTRLSDTEHLEPVDRTR